MPSVGPVKIPIMASVGDFAGPVRNALRAVQTEMSGLQGSFGQASAQAAASAPSTRQIAKQAAVRQASKMAWEEKELGGWNEAMLDVRRDVKRANAFTADEKRERQLWRETQQLRGIRVSDASEQSKRNYAEIHKEIRRKGLIDQTATLPVTVGSSDIAAATAEAAAGGGGGIAGRGFRLPRMLGTIIGNPAMMAGKILTQYPLLAPLAAGYAAYKIGERWNANKEAGGKLGMTGTDYAALSVRASMADVSSESVTRGVQHMREAAAGGQLEGLGVAGKSTADALERMAKVLRETVDPADQLRIGVRAFGADALEMMKTLSGMQPMSDTARARAFLMQGGGGPNAKDAVSQLLYWLKLGGNAAVGGVMEGTRVLGYGIGVNSGYQSLATREAEDRRQATAEGKRRMEADKLDASGKEATKDIAGRLASPREKLKTALEAIGYNMENKIYSMDPTKNKMYAGRAAGLAAEEYESATGKNKINLAGANAADSTGGYSQIVEAIYGRETAVDVGKQTNAILQNWFPQLVGAVKEQRGFASRVDEGPN